MNIAVCIKRVPETAEAAVNIDSSEKRIVEDQLVFDINEADNYALEEALLLKEKTEGDITLFTVGPKKADEVIKMGLAKGATLGVRITPENLDSLDSYTIAKLLAEPIKEGNFDLVLTGCISSDAGNSQVGVTLAELLGVPHASLVINMEIEDDSATVQRELEGGLLEELKIKIPALFTIQTGINEPRYASILGIKRAAQKEIKVVENITVEGMKTEIVKMYYPPAGKMAEILEGGVEEVSGKLCEILKGKGLL
ncbi:electron transfer flavoprotein subunit beta/FixA family protein [candidate division WOR-3 bacterium]|nr:electron transfer flavoprotein subunit beta/FixA family protein [candidate division WOR-3 bacterium]